MTRADRGTLRCITGATTIGVMNAQSEDAIWLNPDHHPDRYINPGEAFAAYARALRDVVLPDASIRTVYVMVGCPGSGKSHVAEQMVGSLGPDSAVLDACHADRAKRRALARKLRRAGKVAVAVYVRTPLDIAQARDSLRPADRRVGLLKIGQQHSALRREPPVPAEGWDRVEHRDGFDASMGVP